MKTNDINKDAIEQAFEYKDGELLWKYSKGNAKKGSLAGGLDNQGYARVAFNKSRYKVHRIVWVLHFGDIPEGLEIDHINRNRSDNRIENLRLVTHSQNNFNTRAKGYTWDKKSKKWKASIQLDRKRKELGRFTNKKDARQAYLDAKKIIHVIDTPASLRYHPRNQPMAMRW